MNPEITATPPWPSDLDLDLVFQLAVLQTAFAYDYPMGYTDQLPVRKHGTRTLPSIIENNISVGLQYLESWLRGVGAVAIYNLMEDAATAEISRSQIWQWVRNGKIDERDVHAVEDAELERLRDGGRWDDAREVFEQVALGDEFVEFLTIPAYEHLE